MKSSAVSEQKLHHRLAAERNVGNVVAVFDVGVICQCTASLLDRTAMDAFVEDAAVSSVRVHFTVFARI